MNLGDKMMPPTEDKAPLQRLARIEKVAAADRSTAIRPATAPTVSALRMIG
ncbi:hypothetical protein [Bradyrhizobium sp. WSM471]|uniref:hypothetical protein n=1 Tax=Bradyrhizobium sp. WSM471 TaxID=319017 RepID=UPI0002F25F47|nr:MULTISPECIES: hypothetical protein [Bradyrhizobium]UFW42315.1 hypothetical protein BcanWSM471_03645 [Bradyrhizobium canariense]